MKKITVLIGIILVFAQPGFSQSEVDALRYSQLYFGGSARSNSMGGAFGAIGADMSSLSTNPAGIGLYNRSEISITPGLNFGETESMFLGNQTTDSRYNFGLQNVGAVFSFGSGNELSDWKKFQFGIGVNRLRNFNNQFQVVGENKEKYGTILEPYWNYATNGGNTNIQPSELDRIAAFDAYLAYDANLLYDVNTETDRYEWGYDAIYGGVQQRKTVETKGAVDEMFISFGSNYRNRLYIGATLGFQNIEYKEENVYHEVDVADTIPYFNSLTKYDNLTTTGSGVNLKLGAIYRAAPWLRVGAALHTPTFYGSMKDEWDARMESSLRFDSGDESYSSQKQVGEFDYELITPMRMIGSIAVIAGQYGLISADYELVNYSAASLDSDTDDFRDANDYIDDNFQRQHNLRLGTEWRYSNFYFRGGYSLYGSPYKNNEEYGETTFQTFGIGYRTDNFFLDFAYTHQQKEDTYYIYDANYAPLTTNEYSNERFITTIGFTF